MLALDRRGLFDAAPPEPRTRLQNHPTLLFSWWSTAVAFVIVLFRLAGRFVRSERFFREDKVMALSLVPLFVRMALVHVILLYDTNNVDTTHLTDPHQIWMRGVGSRLVLAARISYAAFIWTAKLGVCDFLARMIESDWRRSYELTLGFIRYFLLATFVAVVIATLGECQPFDHYWQVVPDPGPGCRQGYAQLITMGACDIITDILLICFPIPMVLRSAIPLKRKLRLVLLFSMSSVLIAITSVRVPRVIGHRGLQQYRTVFASGEILAAAAVSNAIVLGSFLRDRGVKKQRRYKWGSTTDSVERASQRRVTITSQQWGSDEDLVREMGWRLAPDLEAKNTTPRPAPIARPASPAPHGRKPSFVGTKGWQFPDANGNSRDSEESDLKVAVSTDPMPSPKEIRLPAKRNVAFFDVGGLLEPIPPSGAPSVIMPSPTNTTNVQDFATSGRGSRALLQDLGSLRIGGRRPSQHLSWQEGECYELTPRSEATRSSNPNIIGPPSEHHETIRSPQDLGGLVDGGNQGQGPERPQTPPRRESNGSTVSPLSSPTLHPRPSSRTDQSAEPTAITAPPPSSPPTGILGPMIQRRDVRVSLQDVGNLLSEASHQPPSQQQ